MTEPFIGQYIRKIDRKRRMVLPAQFRNDSMRFVLVWHNELIKLYEKNAWHKLYKTLSEEDAKALSPYCYSVMLDSANRILIPPLLQKHFSEYVEISGVGTHFEIRKHIPA